MEEAQNKYDSASAALQTAISKQTAAEEAMISATTAVDDAKAEWNAKGEAALIAQGELIEANIDAVGKYEAVIERLRHSKPQRRRMKMRKKPLQRLIRRSLTQRITLPRSRLRKQKRSVRKRLL